MTSTRPRPQFPRPTQSSGWIAWSELNGASIKARQPADAARNRAAQLADVTALAMLVGAFVASAAAALGWNHSRGILSSQMPAVFRVAGAASEQSNATVILSAFILFITLMPDSKTEQVADLLEPVVGTNDDAKQAQA